MKKGKSFRLPIAILNRIETSLGSGTRCSRVAVFEEAIDLISVQHAILAPMLVRRSVPSLSKRRSVPASDRRKINTKLSEEHLRKLAHVADLYHRSETTVMQVALEALLRLGSEARKVREASDSFFFPPLNVKRVPQWRIGEIPSWLSNIRKGAYVLFDGWALFGGMVTMGSERASPPLSQECQNLLYRCANGELVGMISPLALQRLQILLSKVRFRQIVPTGEQRIFQMQTAFRRIALVSDTAFKLLPLEITLLNASAQWTPAIDPLKAWELTCAGRFAEGPFAVASASTEYDRLAQFRAPAGIQFSLHKPYDLNLAALGPKGRMGS